MEVDLGHAGAFVAGLLSFASPCVLPIVPPYLCFLAGVGIAELRGEVRAAGGAAACPSASASRALRLRIVLTALAFALGFGTIFIALGAGASWIGQALGAWFDTLRWIAGGIILLMGLHFLGVLRIPLLMRELRPEVSGRPAGLGGAYLVGLAFGFGWTPCVGPVLSTVLFVAGAEETAGAGALLLAAYAAGMGLPFVLAALFAGPFLALMGRFRRRLGQVERAMGALLVATGVLFMTDQMAPLAYWMLERLGTRG